MDSERVQLKERGVRPLLLDGAMGTLLEARGVACPPPLWTAQAMSEQPEEVAAVHRAYAAAGAEVLTANTFRTRGRSLIAARSSLNPRALTLRAVDVARRAAEREDGAARGRPETWVAGSLAPLEDCYRPERVPDDASLVREHREHADHLAEAGCDLILVETHNSVREARVATRAAAATGLPVWTSFVCGARARLLSGEPLAGAVQAAIDAGALAVGINCTALDHCGAALEVLAECGHPFGLAPNLRFDPSGSAPTADPCAPARFAETALAWQRAGARYLGACCGSGPDHVAALRRVVDHEYTAPAPKCASG